MKSKLLNAGLFACALLMMLSGCSTDETLTGDNNKPVKSMKITISDGMFTSVDNSGAKTRATDDGTETTFVSGDAVGIFAVKSDGTFALINAKYTYDGISKWLNSDNTDYLPYYAGAKYFAYYPYQASLSSDKYDATKSTTAETFFGTLISGWSPAADQSTQDKYTAQDLMVSKAIVNVYTRSCIFVISHQMSMVEIDLPQYHYIYNGGDTYRFTFNTVKPYNMAAGTYRLLVNPSTALSITGKNQYSSTDATKTKGWNISGITPAAAKYKVYKYKGASAFLSETKRDFCFGTANIGDYLYDDGTTGTTTVGKTIVGIVFSNEISTVEYNKGYTHGYALALADAGLTLWQDFYTTTGLTNVQTYSAYYNDINSGYYGTFTLGYNGNSNYSGFASANNYNVAVTGFTNSGWYLPSAGQWWDVCANLGKVDLTGNQISTTDYGGFYYGSIATTNVNNAIIAAGGAALGDVANYYWYWSASQYSVSDAVVVGFSSDVVNLYYIPKDLKYCCVRSVLAF